MAAYTVTVSPSELLTRYSNALQVTVQNGEASISSVSMVLECRLIAGEKVRETYLVSEKKYQREELPSENPMKLQWSVDVPRKGPLTFSCADFSIEYMAVIEIVDGQGGSCREEKPVKVVPGRIAEAEIETERNPGGSGQE